MEKGEIARNEQFLLFPHFFLKKHILQTRKNTEGVVWERVKHSTFSDAGCPLLTDIENGWVTQDIATSIGSIATYECDEGYFLAGRAQRKCKADGTWEGVQPSCETGNHLKCTFSLRCPACKPCSGTRGLNPLPHNAAI